MNDNAWAGLRVRRAVFWLLFLMFMPVCTAANAVSDGRAVPWVAFPWMLIWIASGIYALRWPCPRCRQAFGAKCLYGNIFARRCVHCGLRIGETQRQ